VFERFNRPASASTMLCLLEAALAISCKPYMPVSHVPILVVHRSHKRLDYARAVCHHLRAIAAYMTTIFSLCASRPTSASTTPGSLTVSHFAQVPLVYAWYQGLACGNKLTVGGVLQQ
jgi:hypothetical protein